MQRIYKLKGVVQPYAWGGKDFIPSLTGFSAGAGLPAAEYWLGAHPSAPSVVDIEGEPTLLDLIREKKQDFLGENLSGQYDALPFLVKILDVKEMLSIQVHPGRYSAEKGFEKENKASIHLTAAERNYKDPNQKIEVMFALSDFWLLRGFRLPEKLGEFFSVPEFSFMEAWYAEGGYELLYKQIMKMDQTKVNEVLKPLAERVTLLYNENKLSKNDPDFWAARALRTYFTNGNIDRGIFSIYLLNLIHLSKGQCVDQVPGDLHAYLEGQNVEIMSNSDNVLRAGLTNKHVDIEEVLANVCYGGMPVDIHDAEGTTVYSSSDFLAVHFTSPRIGPADTDVPMIVLVIKGSVAVQAGSESVNINSGESVYVVPGSTVQMSASTDVEFFVVSVPKKES